MKHQLADHSLSPAITTGNGRSAAHLLPAIGNRLARLLAALATWHDRAVQRRVLLAMDERMLHDIGISRVDAWQEARKPCWRE